MKGFILWVGVVGMAVMGMVALVAEEKGDSMMSASTMEKGFYDVSKLGPSVTAYKAMDKDLMVAKTDTVVYYFAASWCPDCQATYKDLQANYKQIPANFHLVVVNYDTAKELKAKYGITRQHTFVKVDAAGKAVKTWLGSKTVAEILKTAAAM